MYYWNSPYPQIHKSFWAVVTKVHDGDTVRVKTDFRDFDFPIRFARINTPELNDGGQEAKEWTKNLLYKKEVYVQIEYDGKTGRYGRIIGDIIFLGCSVNDELVNLGLANPFERKNEGKIPKLEVYLKKEEIKPQKWY